jgi:hypothetical protein
VRRRQSVWCGVKVLLDTHALLWWFAGDPALPRQAEALIDDPSNTVLVSAASAWDWQAADRSGAVRRFWELLKPLPLYAFADFGRTRPSCGPPARTP